MFVILIFIVIFLAAFQYGTGGRKTIITFKELQCYFRK